MIDDVKIHCIVPFVPAAHFLGYDVEVGDEDDTSADEGGIHVALADQFLEGEFTVNAEPKMLFNPVNKNDEGLTDTDTHLLRYDIVEGQKIKVIGNKVKNQFGEVTVDVQGPNFLLVPSSKAIQGEPLPELPGDVDHFLCYETRPAKGSVTLEDQFQKAEFAVKFGKYGKYLCNPVEKTVTDEGGTTATTGIQNENIHLMCFEVQGPGVAVTVQTDNQFGPETLEVDEPELLCLPSEKKDIGPPTDDDDDDDDDDDEVGTLPPFDDDDDS